MGFFSWITQDTKQSIPSKYAHGVKTFPVTMTDNEGNSWTETDYEGYGEFGGKDFYELLAEMNGLGSNRDLGIDLAFSGKAYLSPNLNEDPDIEWTDTRPKECPHQGFFYSEYPEEHEQERYF